MPETTKQDWRDDPRWRIVWAHPDLWSNGDAPARPTPEAELAQPPIWASLYENRRLVAIWERPSASDDSATVAAE